MTATRHEPAFDSARRPAVSIGLPVRNGADYLPATMDSLLTQSVEDLELIISDNGSTDATEEVCRDYAARDARIRYVRSDRNWGASWNHNIVAQLARGRYFKWSAADDLCAPDFLLRCIEALDADPSAVLALPGVVEIDQDGHEVGRWQHELRVGHPDVHIRFRDLICIGYECYHIYGLIRADALRRTGLIGYFIESDMVTLAELALYGRFLDLPGEDFLHRTHHGQSVAVHESRYDRAAWFDPRMGKRLVFPVWRLGLEYARAVDRAPLTPEERRRCLAQLGPWTWHRKGSLAEDLRWARQAGDPVHPRRLQTVE